MNTVLDDNKKLCLMSGEIIQMSNKQDLIFEPEDLEVASPATVSRCDMIYMEPHQLGRRPHFESYMNTLPDSINNESRQMIRDMFEWTIDPCLDFLRHECHTFVNTSGIHLACSLMRLFSCLMEEIKRSGVDDQPQMSQMQTSLWLQCLFLFSLIWSIGGTMNGDSRQKFDVFFRTLISGTHNDHPRPKTFKLGKDCLKWKVFGTGIITSLTCMNVCMYVPNFSAQTSANQTQDSIMSKLDRHRKWVYGPPMGKKSVIFVDDLNMPAKEKYGAQPPIELSLVDWHFNKGFEAVFTRLGKSMVQATMSVYKSAVSIFLPIPSKYHVFILRDFVRVVQGVLLVLKTHMKEGDKLIRLWVHEVYRVFYDRLIDDEDRQRFFEIVCNETQQHFKMSLDKLLKDLTTSGTLVDDNIRGLFFGDYMIPGVEPRIYDQVTDFEELTSTIEIVGGSGRQSATKLAAFVADYHLF